MTTATAAAREDVMVTGRMSAEKKSAGNRVLAAEGLTASQAINLMYDMLVKCHNVEFLGVKNSTPTQKEYADAATYIDGLRMPHYARFDTMTDAEITMERLRAKGEM